MSNTVDVYFLFKIMPIEYIDNFAKGNFYFSCCGNWVDIAKKGFGKGQGDKYEGVFAKYKRKNSRKPVKYYKTLFKKDLKIEQEGDYVLLRRISSLYIPAICFYSLDNNTSIEFFPEKEKARIEEIINNCGDAEEITVDKFPLGISDKYLSEFSIDSDKIDAVTIQPRKVLNEFKNKGLFYQKVTYIDMDTEFDIIKDKLYEKYGFNFNDAIDKHIEIFFKDKANYSHQCELRAIILDERLKSIKRGKTIHLDNLSSISVSGKDGAPVNATGKDFICYTKNARDLFGKVVLKKLN